MTLGRKGTKRLAVEYRPVADLVPYARNARTHSDAQIDQVVASIREFGWTNPVLLDGKSGIIAGHARLEAAKRLGLAEIPCIELSGLSEAQKRAYIIERVGKYQKTILGGVTSQIHQNVYPVPPHLIGYYTVAQPCNRAPVTGMLPDLMSHVIREFDFRIAKNLDPLAVMILKQRQKEKAH